jgi:adenylate cyclase
VPLGRVEAFVRTLHPHIVGRSFLWTPGAAVQVRENSFAYLQSPDFLASPAAEVFQTGKPVRCRLDGPTVHAGLAGLKAEGFTDYYAGPLTFLNGQVHAIDFATKAKEGFTDAQLRGLDQVLRPLSRVAEILALSRTAANLLDTYVGRKSGERILSGQITRGQTDTIQAVIWMTDLRGFTALSGTLAPNMLIRLLNDLFECQVPAIERHGGEVLKFMGDGLLAIFPTGGPGRSEPECCERAVEAAREAYGSLVKLNARRRGQGEADIRFGLALHVGEIAYGNIGGAGRQDFTVIGPAVNLAARLESLTSKLSRPAVASEVFAARLAAPLEPVGTFDLKGVDKPAHVLGWPAADILGAWPTT